jgi:Domain of unknown function (DUF5615)
VLLDENLPRKLARNFDPDVVALTVAGRGWAGLENGELLELAQEEFDVFVTVDKGIPHQQDLSRFDIAVIVLEARSNAIEDLVPLVPRTVEALRSVRPKEAIRVTNHPW